uniref:RNA methyltransferase n=1 Tax=Nicotiana tabacum TaxID=4097 RepID=A0A1S4BNA0_TOBAC|nr:PREDICTED: probable RNA methyltransferase At5g51130 [Nicotiana tabacum]XP_016490347.1 PREDICTED: probable RNA methyltransferase At5g51130 [Nicotiana tabacum]
MEHQRARIGGEQQEDTSATTQKKKRKEVALYGNYRNYYGYRNGKDLEEDPRLKAMKKEWFEGKDCLDIGCNSGVITIAIARKFSCRSILGIDIDGARVNDAYWTLRREVKSLRTVPAGGDKLAESKTVNCLKDPVAESLNKRAKNDCTTPHHLQEGDFFDIVSFKKGDFIQNWHPRDNTSYDTIICLSVSKWVHLNGGDDGLIALFSKVWRLLSPGGVFILEPQPWKSYYENRLVSETTRINYQNIKIRPEDFQDILLDKIGFRMVEDITSSVSGCKTGFKRPILAFWK